MTVYRITDDGLRNIALRYYPGPGSAPEWLITALRTVAIIADAYDEPETDDD